MFVSLIAAEILVVIERLLSLFGSRKSGMASSLTDSMYIVHLLSSSPCGACWNLKVAWANCLLVLPYWLNDFPLLAHRHIYQEGNCLADAFANLGGSHDCKYWWCSVPDFAMAFLRPA